jgi:fumarate reductase subunit C
MSKEAYLMRREIAIIAAIFFLFLIALVLFSIGSLTQVNLPV